MKVAVLGSGAMGSLYGAMLSKKHDVWLVDVWQEQVDTINREGLKLQADDGTIEKFSPRATTDSKEVGPVDLLVVFVKSTQTYQALDANRALLDDHTMVLSLQNGFGNHEEIAKIVAKDKIVVGTTTSGATLLRPGVVGGFGLGIEHIGTLVDDQAGAQFVVDAFEPCGLKPEICDTIMEVIWSKVIVNIGINAIVALMDRTNNYIALNPHARKLSEIMVREAVAAANADGCHFDADASVENVYYICEFISPHNRASMLQDITYKRRTEIDTIYGSVVRIGKQHNVPTPYTEFMVELIKAKEDTYLTQQ